MRPRTHRSDEKNALERTVTNCRGRVLITRYGSTINARGSVTLRGTTCTGPQLCSVWSSLTNARALAAAGAPTRTGLSVCSGMMRELRWLVICHQIH